MTRILYKIILLSITLLSLSCSCSNDNDSYTPVDKITYEEGEELLIGQFSIGSQSNNAFGHKIPGLIDNEGAFETGNSLFNQSWVSSPASTTARDGLGPTFNAKACASCHFKDGRGRPPLAGDTGESNGFLMRISIPGESMNGGPLEVPHYGDQIQDHANLNIPAEAKVLITYETVKGNYPDGTPYELRKPVYAIQNEEFGSLQTVLTSPRIAQQTIGLGFIDALDDAAILANVDEFDTDKDGISGKANYVWDVKTNTLKIGKFGWKSNQPSLEQQIAGAFNGDMGLTTYLFPENNCPSPQNDCANAPNGGAPEVTDRQLKHVLIYQAALAVPTRRDYKKENVLKGKNLFRELACIKCHVDNFVTDNNYAILPQIQNIQVRPYSDFLLHDMGEKLADNRPDFLASGREWRTQPLWGIGLIETVNNHTFLLHDGRARNIEEAILWHGGEAEKSKNDFMQLTQAERQYLLDFINSL